MKKILVHRKILFGKRKAEVMQKYNLSEEEYHFVHEMGLQRDANNKVLEEWVVEIPDNLGGNANPQMHQQNPFNSANPQAGAPNCKANQQWAPQSYFNQYGFPQINNPFCESNPIFMQQQYQYLAQQCMNEANDCFAYAQRRRMELCSFEEYNYYLNICNDYQQRAEYYMSLAMANPPQWNQMSTTIVSNSPFGQTNTSISAVNTKYSNMFMGMELANYGANVAGNFADNLVKIADAFGQIISMIKAL